MKWRRAAAMAGAVIVLAGGLTWATAGDEPRIHSSEQRIAVVDGPKSDQHITLDTTFFTPARPGRVPAVLLAHGFGGSKEDTRADAERLARHGYAVLTWSARGFGASGGDITLDSPDYDVKDVRQLLDWLARRPEVRLDGPGDPRVGVAGSSYGGGIALMATAYDHRIDAIAPQITWYDLADSLFPDATGKGATERRLQEDVGRRLLHERGFVHSLWTIPAVPVRDVPEGGRDRAAHARRDLHTARLQSLLRCGPHPRADASPPGAGRLTVPSRPGRRQRPRDHRRAGQGRVVPRRPRRRRPGDLPRTRPGHRLVRPLPQGRPAGAGRLHGDAVRRHRLLHPASDRQRGERRPLSRPDRHPDSLDPAGRRRADRPQPGRRLARLRVRPARPGRARRPERLRHRRAQPRHARPGGDLRLRAAELPSPAHRRGCAYGSGVRAGDALRQDLRRRPRRAGGRDPAPRRSPARDRHRPTSPCRSRTTVSPRGTGSGSRSPPPTWASPRPPGPRRTRCRWSRRWASRRTPRCARRLSRCRGGSWGCPVSHCWSGPSSWSPHGAGAYAGAGPGDPSRARWRSAG